MISWCKYRECGRRANQATQAWNRGAVGAFLRRHGACIIWSNSHGVSVPARVSGSPNAFLWRGLAAVGIAVVLVRSADTARSGSFHFQPPPLPSTASMPSVALYVPRLHFLPPCLPACLLRKLQQFPLSSTDGWASVIDSPERCMRAAGWTHGHLGGWSVVGI
jgi:hypothetical protein